METTEGWSGLHCHDCDGRFGLDETTHRCPDCGARLDPAYDDDALEAAHERLLGDGATDTGASASVGLARFAPVLPFPAERLVTTGEGATPLVDCPSLADDLGVARVLCKDEGRNTTGGLVDRELTLAVTAARETGATDVGLASTGNGGQAAAAYAARAGLAAHCFVPSRTPFANKAMINVHGGDMTVVGGRYSDARDAFADAVAEEGWHSLAPFETPFRHEGAKTLAYELVSTLGAAPDAVVHPTGHGTGLVGIDRGFRELDRTGIVDARPRLYAAQAAGCAPLVDAFEADESSPDPVDYPDTICGSLEVPDPAGGALVLDALDATDGGAVAVTDDDLLGGAVSLAGAGVPTSATGGVGTSGAHDLADRGAFDADDTVVVVDPVTANREADVLRSHLMKQGK